MRKVIDYLNGRVAQGADREEQLQFEEALRILQSLAVACPTPEDLDAWFDSWGKGPFTFSQVRRWASQHPHASDQYHITVKGRRVTYSQYVELWS